MAEAILGDYDKSFLRITNYTKTWILYFYPVEDQMIAFKDKSYLIFSSALLNEEDNIKSVNEVKSTLVQNIEEIRNQLLTELQSYSESNTAFINRRNMLLNKLMELKYTSKLNFEKKKIVENVH